jgi:hypothetical protein
MNISPFQAGCLLACCLGLLPAPAMAGPADASDASGHIALPPAFRSIGSFDPVLHVAKAWGRNDKMGLIDAQGHVLLPPEYDAISDFDERGFAMLQKHGKEGMVDASGRVRIPLKYEQLDISLVANLQGKPCHYALLDGKYGYVDDDGNVVVPFEYDELDRFFGQKKMAAGKKHGKFGVIGQDGQVVIPFVYAWLSAPLPRNSKGQPYYFQAKYQGKYGLLGLDGQWRVPPQFDFVYNIGKNGWAPARLNGETGYIDGQGHWTITPRFADAMPFDSGNQRSFAAILQTTPQDPQGTLVWGMIDTKGNWVVQPMFSRPPGIEKFTPSGVAAVVLVKSAKPANCFGSDCEGLIDANGKWVVPPIFTSIDDQGWKEGHYKTPYVEAEYWTPGGYIISGNKLYPNGRIEYGTYKKSVCGAEVEFDEKDRITLSGRIHAAGACASRGLQVPL